MTSVNFITLLHSIHVTIQIVIKITLMELLRVVMSSLEASMSNLLRHEHAFQSDMNMQFTQT